MGDGVIGSVQNVLVCTPSDVASRAQSIDELACPTTGGQTFVLRSMQVYVLDPSAQSLLESAARPFDYEYAGVLWSVAFTMIVGLYLVSAKVGAVLGLIRQG